MLKLTIPDKEQVRLWDEVEEQFITLPAIAGMTIRLEHSLASLSKWESITKKPFLSKEEKTQEETVLYIKCMDLSEDTPEEVYTILTGENFEAISAYIDDKMTATTFNEDPNSRARNTGEFITAEIIYHWMVSLTVPFECQHWHLNKLLALIKVINLKNAPAKKTGRRESIANRRMMNQQRKAQMGTRG